MSVCTFNNENLIFSSNKMLVLRLASEWGWDGGWGLGVDLGVVWWGGAGRAGRGRVTSGAKV